MLLNIAGDDGWELVAITTNHIAILKQSCLRPWLYPNKHIDGRCLLFAPAKHCRRYPSAYLCFVLGQLDEKLQPRYKRGKHLQEEPEKR